MLPVSGMVNLTGSPRLNNLSVYSDVAGKVRVSDTVVVCGNFSYMNVFGLVFVTASDICDTKLDFLSRILCITVFNKEVGVCFVNMSPSFLLLSKDFTVVRPSVTPSFFGVLISSIYSSYLKGELSFC